MDKKYRILIIDDDAFLLNMYVTKFKKSGHEVDIAKSSADALSKLKEGFNPDIVLIDVVLPGMDGLELLGTIRKENLCPTASYIMFTNQGDSKEMEKAKELNVAGYLVKASFVPSEVVAKVLEIVENKK